MREKGVKLLQAQKLVQFLRECEDVMDWINDKVHHYLFAVFFLGNWIYLCGNFHLCIVAGVQVAQEKF